MARQELAGSPTAARQKHRSRRLIDVAVDYLRDVAETAWTKYAPKWLAFASHKLWGFNARASKRDLVEDFLHDIVLAAFQTFALDAADTTRDLEIHARRFSAWVRFLIATRGGDWACARLRRTNAETSLEDPRLPHYSPDARRIHNRVALKRAWRRLSPGHRRALVDYFVKDINLGKGPHLVSRAQRDAGVRTLRRLMGCAKNKPHRSRPGRDPGQQKTRRAAAPVSTRKAAE